MKGAIVAAVLLAACGAKDPSPTPAPSGPTPSQQCRTFVETYCGYTTVCARETNAITEEQREQYNADCIAGASLTTDCSRVVQIHGSPSDCDAEIAALPCSLFDADAGLPLPASCVGLFLR